MSHQTPAQLLPWPAPEVSTWKARVERAMNVFWTRGYHATALPDPASRDEAVARQSLRGVGDQHSLFLLALDRYIADAHARMDLELDPRRDPVDGLRACLAGYVDRNSGANGRRGCLLVAIAMELAGRDADVDRRIGSFSRTWRPGWLVHSPVRRQRASWPMVSSLRAPPEFWSVSSKACGWSAKRRRHGSFRKPPSTPFSSASSGKPSSSAPHCPARRYIDRSVVKGRKPCLPSRSLVRVLVPLLWGYQFVAIKVGVMEFPPLFFLGLRFLAIALLLVPFVKRPTRQQLGPVAAISVFLGGLNFGLFYVGLGLGSGSISAVAYQLAPPFTVLLAWPLLAERPSLTTSAGVVLALGGVVVLAAGPGLSANALPLLLVVGAAFAFAVSNVLTKRYGPFDPLMLMGWFSLLTVPQVMLMSLLLEHGQVASLVTADQRGWLALAYTIFIGGIAGFGLWFWLIGRCSMGRVALFGLLLPVFALMSSVLFLATA